jgi:hypothetical protein
MSGLLSGERALRALGRQVLVLVLVLMLLLLEREWEPEPEPEPEHEPEWVGPHSWARERAMKGQLVDL